MTHFACYPGQIKTASFAFILATIGAAAQATPVEISKQDKSTFGTNGAATVTILDSALQPKGDRVRAGGFALSAAGLGDFVAWCLDIGTSLRLSSDYRVTKDRPGYAPYPNTTTMSLDQKDRVQAVFNAAYRDLDLTQSADSAGFQLALWEVLYEDGNDYSVTSGSFSATGASGVVARANDILSTFEGTTNGQYRMTFLESDELRKSGAHKSQNLVTIVPTPLPAAGFLMLAGLAGLGALRRFKGQ